MCKSTIFLLHDINLFSLLCFITNLYFGFLLQAKENDRDVSVAEVFQMINFDKENGKWYSSGSEAAYVSISSFAYYFICEYILTPSTYLIFLCLYYFLNLQGLFKKRKEDALLQGREVDDSTLFYEATGGKNRQGRAYGFGSTVKLYEDRSRSKGTGASQSSTIQVEILNDRVDQLEQVNVKLAETNARLVEEVAEMRVFFQSLQGQLNTSSSLVNNPTSTDHVGENLGGDASGGNSGDGVDDEDGYGFI